MVRRFRIQVTRSFAVLLFAVLLVTSSAWEAKGPFLSALFFFAGAILVGIASLGRLWCSVYIAGYKTETLVTEGPYSISRNPLYFFSLLGALGVGLASERLLIPLAILVAFALYYPGVIRHEEAKLRKRYEKAFNAYRANVPCFFPRFSLLKEPQEYAVKPIIFRRHLFSALWFVWLIGFLELIEELHELEMIPTVLAIY